MTSPLFAPVPVLVHPEDCDPSGSVHGAGLVRLFERARWQALTGDRPPLFDPRRVWLTTRRLEVERFGPMEAGDRLVATIDVVEPSAEGAVFRQTLTAGESADVTASAQVWLTCIDEQGHAAPLPAAFVRAVGGRASLPSEEVRLLTIRGGSTAVDVQGAGPAILFVHGFPLDHAMWRPVGTMLTAWRRIAPDLRGLGTTEIPDGAYTMGDYADDMVALLDALHVERAVVCGLSMGGYVAFEMWRRYRDRVRALILCNTQAKADGPDQRAARDAMAASVSDQGMEVLSRALIPKLLNPGARAALPKLADELHETMVGASPEGVATALAAIRDRPDSTDTLASIDVPTLVIAGKDDQIVPVAEAKRMAAAIPSAQFTVIPDAGHLAPLEQPIAVGRVMSEFLGSLP